MRKTILASVFFAAFAVCGHAQNTQELIEAYRNGTLTQSQIDKYNNTAAAESDQNRNREIQVENVDELPQGEPVERASDNLRSRIFGHDLFTIGALTFESNLSIATPDNYVLGPGDEVIGKDLYIECRARVIGRFDYRGGLFAYTRGIDVHIRGSCRRVGADETFAG